MPIDPGTAMLIGQGLNSAGGILSGFLGMGAQNDALAYNYAAMQENIRRQDEQAFIQRLLADRFFNMQTAPQTDARGNRTEYIPGVGWVSTPSATTDALIKASDAEERNRLAVDAPIRRRGLVENEQRRITEGGVADAFLSQLMQQPSYSVDSLRNEMLSRATQGTNEAYDRTLDRFGTQAIRSGASNAGDIMASINRQRGKDVRDAGAGVDADARLLFDQLEGNRTSRLGNLYNVFATRASNFEDVPFAPNNLSDTLANRNSATRNTTAQIAPTVISASSNPGGFYPTNIQPNNGMANFAGGSLSNIGGLFEQYGSQQQYNQLLDMFQQRQLGNA